MRKIKLIIIIFTLVSSLTSGFSQSLPALPRAKEIVKGTLANGMDYYLVSNGFQKGFADYAIVQQEVINDDREKKALTFSTHFGIRPPYHMLSENGVRYGKDGFVTKLPNATVYKFKDVPTYKSAVADSTLLMVMDIATTSRKPQAIIISGDIDINKVKERMSLLSLMSGRLESLNQSSDYKWIPRDSILVRSFSNQSEKIATIEAVYRSKRQSKTDMNTALPLVIRSYSNIFEDILRQRITKSFASEDIPLASFDFKYNDSAKGPFDEYFSIKLSISKDDLEKATQILAAQLSSLDKYGASVDEVEIATLTNDPSSTIKSAQRHILNSEYIDKCVDAYLYGANLAPEELVNSNISNRKMSSDQKQKLFNNFISALLDDSKQLSLNFTSPDTIDEIGLKGVFLDSWSNPKAYEHSYTTIQPLNPQNRTKIKREDKDSISGGNLWTFANGMKVVFKHLPTQNEFSYSLVVRSGISKIDGLNFGEAAYINELLKGLTVGGLDSYSFNNQLYREGISLSIKASVSNLEISGTAPSQKLEKLLSTLLSVTKDSSLDPGLFDYFKTCSVLKEDLCSLYPLDVNPLMESKLRPNYLYSSYPNAANMGNGLSYRVDDYLKDSFKHLNDGVFIILGDLNSDELKKQLCRYLGDFADNEKAAPRSIIKSDYLDGVCSVEELSKGGAVGGNEISANMAISAPLTYSVANKIAFDAAMLVLQKSLSAKLADQGAYFTLDSYMHIYPSERMNVFINTKACNYNGLALGVVPSSPEVLMTCLQETISELGDIQVSDEDVKAYIALFNNQLHLTKDNPSLIAEAVKLRYIDGKDVVSNKSSAINSLSAAKIQAILKSLSTADRVEFIVK